MHTVEKINFAFMCLFFACYLYQFLYIPVSWRSAKTSGGQAPLHRFAVLTADNVLDRNFFASLNVTFSRGYDIVTCYRNSKTYGDNWISAGYGLWFLRESRYLNQARMRLGSSCAGPGAICRCFAGTGAACSPAFSTATEWRHIHCRTGKKLAYLFPFPLFMLSYVPIVIQSLFVTPEWTPIRHTRALSVRQICGEFREDAG